MHITQHTDFALRVLIYLGACTERRVTVREVSDRFGISRSHLMKIVNQLVTDGFVEGTRGKGGGLRLARAPEAIGVGEVVRRMEPGFELVECFGSDSRCLLSSGCRLKGAFSRALDAFLTSLDGVTLADLIVQRSRLRGVLEIVPVDAVVPGL
ncbi:MAG: Rrf2 family transcriptional regulator [Rhodocyclaceae bacterium]|nr:Rrf2 family transcriptional regulator [Rhodocyclaceae bacterium]